MIKLFKKFSTKNISYTRLEKISSRVSFFLLLVFIMFLNLIEVHLHMHKLVSRSILFFLWVSISISFEVLLYRKKISTMSPENLEKLEKIKFYRRFTYGFYFKILNFTLVSIVIAIGTIFENFNSVILGFILVAILIFRIVILILFKEKLKKRHANLERTFQ